MALTLESHGRLTAIEGKWNHRNVTAQNSHTQTHTRVTSLRLSALTKDTHLIEQCQMENTGLSV